MNLKDLFVPVNDLTAEEARQFIRDNKEGGYQLVDVRQLKEYNKGHIPGAIHVPLPELADRLDELDRHKPVLAY